VAGVSRLLIVALVVAAIAAAIVANLALLNYATSGNDPVGKLTPRARLPAAPADIVRPQTGTVEEEDGDD
jgi:hypothetical protein